MPVKTIKLKAPFLLFAFFLILFSCSNKKFPSTVIFNSDWKFIQGNDSLAFQTTYNDSSWRNINLPHDWSIEGEFSEDNPCKPAGGALPTGIGWYRKSFVLNEKDKDFKIYIDFDGIFKNSEIWINGHYLDKRANGYISFRYELTPYLKFDGGKNIIAVKVDNSIQPNSRWYTGSGIYRNVWLVKKLPVHIAHWGVSISTPEINKSSAIVHIATKVTDANKNTSVKYSIIDKHTNAIASTVSESSNFEEEIEVPDPLLWSPEAPNLYHVKVEVFDNNTKVDEEIYPLGFRYYHFDADSGFYLNGKHYPLRGVNLHHDLGALGAAVSTRAIERQLELMKGMGVNAIRTSHNPPAPEFLDLCDKMGFLVQNEAFDVWAKKKVKYDYHIDWEENHKKDLQDLILRDRNHPSVFMWSIGNEIREQFDSTGTTIASELVAIVKSIDTTRPVTCALTETDPEKNYIYQSKALDVLGFNYKIFDWKNFKANYPGEKMLAAENMSAYSTRGHYLMPSDSTHKWPTAYKDPILGANDEYTISAYDNVCAYWGATHEETLKELYHHKFIAGMFIWCGIDFIGEPEPFQQWPTRSSYYGVVDLSGFPKDVYYLYQSIWTETPTLHVFPHWNWEEGQLVDVWAYYNQADEVELFLNDSSLGTKSKGENEYHVMWQINYKPGTLKAISRKDGKTVLKKEIQTAGEPEKIELIADRKNIQPNGTDLSFITVKILDKKGNLVPYADNLINFEVVGQGFIAGVDNGYQASHEPFKADYREAFNGMCLVIIQSNGEIGNITMQASSENLKSAHITIKAQ